jgi:hypothetical protein
VNWSKFLSRKFLVAVGTVLIVTFEATSVIPAAAIGAAYIIVEGLIDMIASKNGKKE